MKTRPNNATYYHTKSHCIAPFKNYFDLRGHAHNYNLGNNEDLASNQIRTNVGGTLFSHNGC